VKGAAVHLSIAVVLISAAVVCADVPVVSSSQDSQDIQAVSLVQRHGDIAHPRWVQSARPVGLVSPDSNPRDLLNAALGITLTPPAIDSSTPTEPEAKPTVLPADMSSITMFLTGLGSLGAWQFVRSARNTKFHLGHMPDWYHTGGPMQVGGVSAIDPNLVAPAMVSIGDLLAEQSTQLFLRGAAPPRLRSQCSTPALAAPRAPPHLCL